MSEHSKFINKKCVSLEYIHEAVASYPDETEICALITPYGIQVQLFYADYGLDKANFRLEAALCGIGMETIEITNIIYEAVAIPQYALENFHHPDFTTGTFDLCGILYFTIDSLRTINIKRSIEEKPIFQSMESVVLHTLKTTEYAEDLQFTPNWSSTFINLSGIDTYTKFLELMSDDFQVMDYTVSTVRLIDNLISFSQTSKFEQQLLEGSIFQIKSMLLFKNDLTNKIVRSFSSLENNVISEILIYEKPSSIKINAIEIEPDRYGRIRPIIAFDEITKYNLEHYTIDLLTLDELKENEYQVNDIVEIKFIHHIPKLGNIIQRDLIKNDPLQIKTCYACGSKFIKRSNQFYCTNIKCSSTIFYRMLYANSKNVLNLPFDWHSLHDLVMMQGIVIDLPSLFNLDRSILIGLFDSELVELTLNTLRTRIAQLNGDGFNSVIQNKTQGKFLDALSISGLHQANIKKLQKSLREGDWQWPELSYVLTNPDVLISNGIPKTDVLEIIDSAMLRILELDTLTREF